METRIEIRNPNGCTIADVNGRLADMLMGALISQKHAVISDEKQFVGKGKYKTLDIIEHCKFVVDSAVIIYINKGSYIKIL